MSAFHIVQFEASAGTHSIPLVKVVTRPLPVVGESAQARKTDTSHAKHGNHDGIGKESLKWDRHRVEGGIQWVVGMCV